MNNSDSTRAYKSGKSRSARSVKRAYVKRGTERNNKTTTQRFYTASINVGSIETFFSYLLVLQTLFDVCITPKLKHVIASVKILFFVLAAHFKFGTQAYSMWWYIGIDGLSREQGF